MHRPLSRGSITAWIDRHAEGQRERISLYFSFFSLELFLFHLTRKSRRLMEGDQRRIQSFCPEPGGSQFLTNTPLRLFSSSLPFLRSLPHTFEVQTLLRLYMYTALSLSLSVPLSFRCLLKQQTRHKSIHFLSWVARSPLSEEEDSSSRSLSRSPPPLQYGCIQAPLNPIQPLKRKEMNNRRRRKEESPSFANFLLLLSWRSLPPSSPQTSRLSLHARPHLKKLKPTPSELHKHPFVLSLSPRATPGK